MTSGEELTLTLSGFALGTDPSLEAQDDKLGDLCQRPCRDDGDAKMDA